MATINVALIGQGFMGRSHSNAWGQVAKFFKPPLTPVMHTVFGQPEENPQAFADNWGWKNASTDWEQLVRSPEIGLVDIVTPNYMHAPVARAAIAAGKPVACEKPIAGSLADAREMAKAAKAAKVKTFVWFNYRRCPAVAFAHQLVKAGKIGEIRHVRASYLQDWADESVPLVWRFDKNLGRLGRPRRSERPHRRYGPIRHRPGDHRGRRGDCRDVHQGAFAADGRGHRRHRRRPPRRRQEGQSHRRRRGAVPCPVFRRGGGQFRGRPAGHRQPEPQRLEINGTRGSLKFDFERMNELQFYDATLPRAVQGWTTIMCTHGGDHPYVANWWPDAPPDRLRTCLYERGL